MENSDNTKDRGVIYVALGSRRYLALCACSVQSLRWAGYSGAVRVLVDEISVAQEAFANLNVELVEVEKPSIGKVSSRDVKTRLYDYAPWSQTLFLDCDVIVLRDMARLWDDFGASPLAMSQESRDVANCTHGKAEEIAWTLQQNVSGLQFNAGVILWNRVEETRLFFEDWHREWLRFKDIDQLALLRALAVSKTQVQVFPTIYNCFWHDSVMEALSANVVFWHVLGGRDVVMFRAAFGALFEEKCRVLRVPRRDLQKIYYLLAPKNRAKLFSVLKRRVAHQVKKRAGFIVERWKS